MLQGALRIKTSPTGPIVVARDATPSDTYLTQLTKLFPAEIVSIYAAGKTLLANGGEKNLWWFALLCAAAILVVRFIGTTPATGGRPQYVAIGASLVSFMLWVVALGDWFLPGAAPTHAAPVTSAFALIWTWIAPQIVNRFEPAS